MLQITAPRSMEGVPCNRHFREAQMECSGDSGGTSTVQFSVGQENVTPTSRRSPDGFFFSFFFSFLLVSNRSEWMDVVG